MLQLCSLTEAMAEPPVISIVPDDIISVEVGLSENMKKSWKIYIQTLLDKIQSLGITIQKREKEMNLKEILDIFANPSIEFSKGF
jgi:hydrogenase maturation protease